MKTTLTKGMTPDESKEMEADFVAAYRLRKHITQILLEKIETSRKTLRSNDAFENTNWALMAASEVGYEKAIYEIIALLK